LVQCVDQGRRIGFEPISLIASVASESISETPWAGMGGRGGTPQSSSLSRAVGGSRTPYKVRACPPPLSTSPPPSRPQAWTAPPPWAWCATWRPWRTRGTPSSRPCTSRAPPSGASSRACVRACVERHGLQGAGGATEACTSPLLACARTPSTPCRFPQPTSSKQSQVAAHSDRHIDVIVPGAPPVALSRVLPSTPSTPLHTPPHLLHTPSTPLHAQVVLLSGGRMVYSGPREGLLAWLVGPPPTGLGFAYCPPLHGTAPDWALDLVNVSFSKPEV
jgi:hypothetical protein